MNTLEIILTILFFVLIIPSIALINAVCEATDIYIEEDLVILAGLLWPSTLCIAIICGILWCVITGLYKWYCWCYKMFKKLFKI